MFLKLAMSDKMPLDTVALMHGGAGTQPHSVGLPLWIRGENSDRVPKCPSLTSRTSVYPSFSCHDFISFFHCHDLTKTLKCPCKMIMTKHRKQRHEGSFRKLFWKSNMIQKLTALTNILYTTINSQQTTSACELTDNNMIIAALIFTEL